ncbi:hypothetical protein ACWOQQ_20230 [Enterobacter sp. ESY66]|uniref:hypothetical protein n=1 Tax=Cronobacter sakazakii TaxID=28141 RepID=UPI001DCD218F|nr:hypothetical protein [Cronobacter sakazakii]EGT5208862.1 hypothetical protein [Cronobacter sakazakii]EGT5755666.1 hypothetical protein [Cronobacter sakazakii]EJG0818348.1 hypothetical protein [Cronobacter sakazakii]EJG2181021.1 hypothetical protein [Cronobacter sakazakii]EMC4384499.1 hypothetical protein [Cronobacter sakazakii]
MPEDNFGSPFDGLVYMSWAVAALAILFSLYQLARVIVTIKVMSGSSEHYSPAEYRDLRLQIKIHVVFSAVTMALGIYLLCLNFNL